MFSCPDGETGIRTLGGTLRAPQPLSRRSHSTTLASPQYLAEGEGFEPPVGRAHNGFQDRRNRPLCHPSLLQLL